MLLIAKHKLYLVYYTSQGIDSLIGATVDNPEGAIDLAKTKLITLKQQNSKPVIAIKIKVLDDNSVSLYSAKEPTTYIVSVLDSYNINSEELNKFIKESRNQ